MNQKLSLVVMILTAPLWFAAALIGALAHVTHFGLILGWEVIEHLRSHE